MGEQGNLGAIPFIKGGGNKKNKTRCPVTPKNQSTYSHEMGTIKYYKAEKKAGEKKTTNGKSAYTGRSSEWVRIKGS